MQFKGKQSDGDEIDLHLTEIQPLKLISRLLPLTLFLQQQQISLYLLHISLEIQLFLPFRRHFRLT